MLCQQNCDWNLHFLVKIVQSLVKSGPFSNCYIQVNNQGKTDIDQSLESMKQLCTFIIISFVISSNCCADIRIFSGERCNTFMTMSYCPDDVMSEQYG